MNEQGFIKLSRKYFTHFLWNEPREFSKAEAWLDLIGSARFEASAELVNGRVIEVRRGEIPASRRFLEKRWNWGSTRVKNFIEMLVKQGMANQRQELGQTILTLCKYDFYNDSATAGKPHKNPAANRKQTAGKPQANQKKEGKKERRKEENNPPSIPPGEKVLPDEPDVLKAPGKNPDEGKEKSCAKKEIRNTIPPSPEMVADYCRQRGNRISPGAFFNFYAAKGWVIGKNKMKDWQAAVRTWEDNAARDPARAPTAKPSKFAQIRANVERNLIPGYEPPD